MGKTREEIIAAAIGDGGNTTRGCAALEALHKDGWRVQKPPTDPAALAMSLRERCQFADADAVDSLAMELDAMRRGWGPTTPTERMMRRVDLITVRRYLEHVYEALIELNLNNYTDDDVRQANDGAIESIKAASEGMMWVNDRLLHDLAGIPDRQGNERGQMDDATRAVSA